MVLRHGSLRLARVTSCVRSSAAASTSRALPSLATAGTSAGLSANIVAHSATAATARAPRQPTRTPREAAVEALSMDVFARGNVHLKNVTTLTALPEGLHSYPEVCFIGKPSVGKSTLLSCLLRNPRLGKCGRAPGTTRLLQFFNVGDALLLVDTPGYGSWVGRRLVDKFAVQAGALAILFRYLALRKTGNLRHVYWVMEACARGPVAFQPRDEELLAFLTREQLPFSVVLNKIDCHWRHYAWQLHNRRGFVARTTRSGAPALTPRERCPARSLTTPEQGVARNVHDIYRFLGTTAVPVLGVCSLRQRPLSCPYITALQHDIVYHCTQELPTPADLTYAKLHDLSYAPPRAEDIQRVQLQYPVEAFVLPADDNVTLAAMVAKHEQAKARLVASRTQSALLSAKDVAAQHMQPVAGPVAEQACSIARDATQHALPEPHRAPSSGDLHLPPTSHDNSTALAPTEDADDDSLAGQPKADENAACAAAAVVPSLPVALTQEADYVTAINGVQIPRSMIQASIEAAAMAKEDEMAAFAVRSGAGAYEELLLDDHQHDGGACAAAVPFLQHDVYAQATERELDTLARPRTRSMAHKQKNKLLAKYVGRQRKERSIYMQAEGYMCPWLAGAGQDGRRVVLGAATMPGRGGAVMHGLKRKGFGGRSYSAHTLRNHGRATKKVGFWAA